MRLEEFFKRYARAKGVELGKRLAQKTRKVLSVRAPIRVTSSGRIVAATKATPFAPPRLVSGNLRDKVRTYETEHGMRVVVWAPYGVPLEKSSRWPGWPHAFIAVAKALLGIR